MFEEMGPLVHETNLKHAALDSAERFSKAETASAKRTDGSADSPGCLLMEEHTVKGNTKEIQV